MAGLNIIQQADFSKGMFRNPAPELIPPNGFADAVNALLEEDGSIFRRGGSVYKSNQWTANPLLFLWDGFTAAGNRTLFASAAQFGTLQPDDQTVLNLGGPGTDGQHAASGNGMVFVPVGAAALGTITAWGGSRLTAGYATGTITAALLSRTVTGVGTSFTGNIDPGMIVVAPGGLFVGVVSSVDSNTQLTLHDFAQTAISAGAYGAYPTFPVAPPSVSGVPVVVGSAGDPARLLIGHRNQVKFSGSGNPINFNATDYHQMPEGQVIGLAGFQDQAFVFTTAGVYVISNMNYNLIDAFGNVQQRLTQLTKDVILLDARGIAGYRNQLIVPGTDDIWLMGPAQYPVPISDPIRSLYRSYVQQGFVTGISAVFRNHYILPIVNPTLTAQQAWVDTLIFRLDQGGWTRWAGHGGKSLAFATRSTSPTRRPSVLATSAISGANSRILDLTGAWTPTALNKSDADGSPQQFSVTTRDYPTGTAANHNLVKKIRVRYELADAGVDYPTIQAYFGVGSTIGSELWGTGTWGSFIWGGSTDPGFTPALRGSTNQADAPTDSGVKPFVWLVPQQAPAFYRLKLVCVYPAARLVIREIDSFIRSRSRQ